MGLTIDIVDGSGVDESVSGSNLTRVAYVNGLDTNAPPADSSALLRVLEQAGLPQLFTVHPNDSEYFCNRRVVKPESDSSCTVDLNYFRGVVQGSTWLQTEDTTTIPGATQFHPGSGEQFLILLDVPSGNNLQTKQYAVTASYPQTVRRITYEGSIVGFNIPGAAGSPAPIVVGSTGIQTAKKDQYTSAVNCVNKLPWQGLGVGFWWFNGWSVTTPDRGASNTIRASFMTKITEDWSQYEVLRDVANDKYIAVDTSVVQQLRSQTYNYGVTRTLLNGRNTGILKLGLFALADFIPLFGN